MNAKPVTCTGALICCVWWHTGTRPNIIFIFADDQGYRDVGYHGSTAIQTPTLDRLASEGVILSNYYLQPACSPSRGTLLSGRYQIYTGLRVLQHCARDGLPEEMPTIADAMRGAGYATHIIGKWHVGFYKDELTPTYRGFDSFFGYYTSGPTFYSYIQCSKNSTEPIRSFEEFYRLLNLMKNYDTATEEQKKGFICGYDLHSNETVAWEYNGQYSTHLFSQKAIDIIKSHSEKEDAKPFFLYLNYQAPHGPLAVPEEYIKPYANITNENRRIYAGMIASIDEGVLNITKALEKYGVWNNTVLIFSTDNGGDTNQGANNWPLRGIKMSWWEGGIKGIGFVTSPLIKNRGTVNNGLMHVSDWFPTLVGLAGGDTAGLNLDGFDVWQSISNGDPSPRTELLHNIDPMYTRGSRLNISNFDNRIAAAIRVGNWKLITGNPGFGSWVAPPEDSDLRSLPDPDPRSKNIWLFDLSNDPYETTDLFESHQEKAIELLNKLAEYDTTAMPPNDPPIDLRCNPENFGGAWKPWNP